MFQNLMKGVAWINMFWGEFVSDDNIGSNELREKQSLLNILRVL